MKKVLIVIIISLIMCGCTKESISTDIKKLMNEKEYIIVDVRTKEEYEESHIKNAINIPYDQIDEKIKLDKDKNIFVYCRSGSRSKIAYNTLTELGYTVYDLGAFSTIDMPKE